VGSILTGGMDVCLLCVCVCVCVYFVLLGRGLCEELITRPEDSYRLWRVDVCDHETSWYEEAIARAGLHSHRNKQTTIKYLIYILELWELVGIAQSV
jgi:hypothetical protein